MTNASGVYAIRNAKTSRVYIGKSTDIPARWRQHRRDLARGKHINKELQEDWRQYGPDAFAFEVLEEAATWADLHNAEQRHYAATPPELRYNIAPVNPYLPGRGIPPEAAEEFFALMADITSGRFVWRYENGPDALQFLRSLDERLCNIEIHVFGVVAPTIGSVLFDFIMERGADSWMLARIARSLEQRIGRLEEQVLAPEEDDL